jgi:glucan 1,3-beta-glucosidase
MHTWRAAVSWMLVVMLAAVVGGLAVAFHATDAAPRTRLLLPIAPRGGSPGTDAVVTPFPSSTSSPTPGDPMPSSTVSSTAIATRTSTMTPTMMAPPAAPVFGIAVGPFYLPGQDPTRGTVIDQAQLRTLLARVRGYTRWVRSYGCDASLEPFGAIAHELGFQAVVSAWISGDSAANEQQIACVVRVARAGHTDMVVVGSEVLHRRDLPEDQLLAYLARVQALLPGVPVTTADTATEYLARPRLRAAVPIVYANLYPFWAGVALDDALPALRAEHARLVAAAGSTPVWISEVGWASCAGHGSAPGTTEAASSFLLQVVSWARETNLPYFIFSLVDEAWKVRNEGPAGGCFGLLTPPSLTLKPGMERLFTGEIAPPASSAPPTATWTPSGTRTSTPTATATSVPTSTPTATPTSAVRLLRAVSRGAKAAQPPYECGFAAFDENGAVFYHAEGCGRGGRGFNVAVVDPATGVVLEPGRNFDTWCASWASHCHGHSPGAAMTELIAYLETIQAGRMILLAVADEAGIDREPCMGARRPWEEAGVQALEALGSTQIRSYCFRESWAMIAVKGGARARAEQFAATGEASVSVTLEPQPSGVPREGDARSATGWRSAVATQGAGVQPPRRNEEVGTRREQQ